MWNEFLEYMSYWIEPGELILAFFGLVFLIIIFIAGGKYEKEQQNGNKKGE